MKKKIAFALTIVLAFALGIGGTFAYLTAKTDAVVNTFTIGNVGDLKLEENSGTEVKDSEGNVLNRAHKIIPGVPTTKDPKVTYTAERTDEAVYVFVKINAAASWTVDGATYTYKDGDNECLTWSVNTADWTAVPGTTGVYYKALGEGASLAATSVIAGDVINVNGTHVTEANIQIIASGAGELTFTAYAIQQAGFGSVADAWAQFNA